MEKIVLAADLGGTNLRMAAVTHEGGILHVARTPTPDDVTPEQLLALTSTMAAECIAAIGEGGNVIGVAYASPAPAAADGDGVLSKLPNLPSLNGMDLAAGLDRILGLPVTLENDATAAAIGEHWLGASRNTENSIVITLGTGVGGGLIIDGRPFRGIDGTAGEIGHICVEPDGHPCGCGSHGCIEQYASATALVRMANDAGLEVATARAVYDALKDGDLRAAAVFRHMGRYLGIVAAGLVNVLNPEMIVIGGGVAAGLDAFSDHIRAELNFRAFREPAARVQIVRTQLDDMAGILGAARSALERS
ncbi:MAG: ROK family protein [Pyrinomonadaceae bacterium]